ncbi:phospholipase B1, membrane-associated-like [Antedon mediterranea]|uniref:phospholipase B1, membrane-associated-like n=1 Tax=Antedon mediterranea TaxID=105859 RepID=UPI003AF6DEE5
MEPIESRFMFLIFNVCLYTTIGFTFASANHSNSKETAEKAAGIDFSCHVSQSKTQPKSVHRLTPGDIQVVAALGDSITTGVGIDASYITVDTSGHAFSIGGSDSLTKMTTLPSILKMYNGNLYGYSNGSRDLNVAFIGAESQDMLTQADTLISRMQSDSNIDMERDWKMITLYVGLNDICNTCHDVEKYSSFNYVTNIAKAIERLKEKVPRAYVNVIQIFDVSILRQVDANDQYCESIRPNTCPCIVKKEDAEVVSQLSQQYQEKLAEAIDDGNYDSDTFSVQLQRQNDLVTSLSDETPDVTLLSGDCTHLSRKGHERSAATLWNNLFTAGERTVNNYATGVELVCPEEGAYLSTSTSNNANKNGISFEVSNENHFKNTRLMKKLNHPYYAAMLITLFIIMIALVASCVICCAVKDGKEDRLQLYDYMFDNEKMYYYNFYDNEDGY